jgi:hypothetical protein
MTGPLFAPAVSPVSEAGQLSAFPVEVPDLKLLFEIFLDVMIIVNQCGEIGMVNAQSSCHNFVLTDRHSNRGDA